MQYLTQTFWDPNGAAKHKRIVEKDKQRASANLGSRKNSDSKSQKSGGLAEELDADAVIVEKYYPIAPEQWKEAVCALK